MAKKNKPPKQHECKVCGSYFIKTYSSTQQVCSVACASKYGRQKAEERLRKKQKSDRLQERKRMKALKEKVKTRSDWLNDLQAVFNKFIRLRDRDLPCISCGRYHQGQWHAGHYRSRGAYPELRFDEQNVHKQCSVCNNHKSGNTTEYRINLVRKIGEKEVERLEMKNHPPLKLTVDEIKALIKVYKAKVKELENAV